jgi:hypothetical protein
VLQITRRRAVLGVIGLFVLAMLGLALASREASYMTLYVVGAILLLLGSAAGMGGGIAGPLISREANPARSYRKGMEERAEGLSLNLLILLAGALLIGLGVLINLA